jgi:transcriptional regulator with XRE-family HTH domain
MIGYSQKLVKANKAANQKMEGVKLGKLCIARDINVQNVAKFFGVSRTAVYAWFKGESEISNRLLPALKEFYKHAE